MIRRDTGAVLVPCLPERTHRLVAGLRAAIEASLAGVGGAATVESLLLERRMRDRSRSAVLAQLSRDADLVRALVGDPARLSTLGAVDAGAESTWATLAVGFAGDAQVPARWQVAPTGEPGLTIRLQSADRSIVVEAPDDPAKGWTCDGVADPAFDRGHATLAAFDEAVARSDRPCHDGQIPAATWSDAARAIELAETVPRSLARGRAIDLHREEFTDLGTFRGTMASLGCGLIMAALVVVIVATLLAGVAREFGWAAAGSIADSWPVIVLGVLGVFLALQTIPLLIRGADEGPDRPPET